MKKEKADQQASPKTIRSQYNPHLDQLKAAITEELTLLRSRYRFDRLQDSYRRNGFTRGEIIAAVNELVADGLLEYNRGPSGAVSARMPVVCVFLRRVSEVDA